MKEYKSFGIIGALDDEVNALIAKLDEKEEISLAGTKFYSGKIAGKAVFVACSGVGKVAAAINTQNMISLFKPDCIINTGIAGGTTDYIKTGDIVISSEAVYHDFITDILPPGPFIAAESLIKTVDKICKEADTLDGAKHYIGRIATGDQFITTSEMRDAVIASANPLCVEMEGAAIAHTANLNNTDFLIIRAISDSADDDAIDTFYKFKAHACKVSSGITLKLINAF